MDDSLRRLNSLIDTSQSLIRLIEKYHSKSGEKKIVFLNRDLFFINCLVRNKEIINSIKFLSSDLKTNKISIFILLRPLLLDSLLYYYLFKLVKDKNAKERNNDLNNIIDDCMKDGVIQHYQMTKYELNSNSNISVAEKKEILNNFIIEFAPFIIDSTDLFNLKIQEPKFKIKATYIKNEFKKLDNNCPLFTRLFVFYNLLSKYDHNTIISIKNHFNQNLDLVLFDGSVKMINDCFVLFIKIILNEKVDNEDLFNELETIHDAFQITTTFSSK
jgi:hypothetical protein